MEARYKFKRAEEFDYYGWGIGINKAIPLHDPFEAIMWTYSIQSPQYRRTRGWLTNGRLYESLEDAVLAGIDHINKLKKRSPF